MLFRDWYNNLLGRCHDFVSYFLFSETTEIEKQKTKRRCVYYCYFMLQKKTKYIYASILIDKLLSVSDLVENYTLHALNTLLNTYFL
jgi:hypothetical protein